MTAVKARASAVAEGGAVDGEGAEGGGEIAVEDGSGEAFGVLLDPGGRVAGDAVLPGGEPEEDEAEVLLAGLGEEAVEEGEVEAALGGLDLLPGERGEDGVEGHGGESRPDGLHVVERGGAGVVELSAEHKEGLAVDDELRGLPALLEVRGGGGLGEGERCKSEGGGERKEARLKHRR